MIIQSINLGQKVQLYKLKLGDVFLTIDTNFEKIRLYMCVNLSGTVGNEGPQAVCLNDNTVYTMDATQIVTKMEDATLYVSSHI